MTIPLFHQPVLIAPLLEGFSEVKIKRFVDGTLGFGGHAEALLNAHPEIEEFIGIDQDTDALAEAEKRLQPFEERLVTAHANFRDIKSVLGRKKSDGILLDLGVSSFQLDVPERGFSFMREGPLDMRMNQSGDLTAADIVNTYSEKEISDLLWEYGEERKSRAIARTLVAARKRRAIKTTQDLCEALKPIFPYQQSGERKSRRHPLTQVFQGLRIAVNDEMNALKQFLVEAPTLLKRGGRLAIISFHSLEDRIVKHTLKENRELQALTKKPIQADQQECRANPRSRSAKLRLYAKL